MTTIEVPGALRATGSHDRPAGMPSAGVVGRRARVVGVVGARGGAGASTLAAALADRLAHATATALVDLDTGSAGLDVLVGVERDPGLRWPDLHAARGEVDGADLLTLLPRWGRCAVLSADRLRPAALPTDVVPDVLGALTTATGALVLDLGRADVLAGTAPSAVCDTILLVAPRDLRAVAGALAVSAALAGSAPGVDLRLVVRGPAPGGLGVAEVEEAVDLPLLCAVREDRRLATHLERARVPRAGPLGRAAGRAARLVLDEVGR
ncbi:septum site-determining protein Ssd [Cellulomonas soli]|uniref:Pilus assembly protein FlpE n=1 Tax=Cellulomonas soli TaxID=931535 RepID=A0A512PGE4_9CELL|nr:septum site-determining protein Ssd [Cellulomonas soli]NYI58132.1 secretion/DNA translocation related CpaE-like protein [Cellulomonas soli]GEP70266.1 hypothetical protein CSO01_29810 [Cellulomonas soli]